MKLGPVVSCIFFAVASLSLPVSAQDVELGKSIYQSRCAACHGAEGKGDGIVGVLFQQRPKDLALLSKENGGVFPVERVYQSIDGRQRIAGHGETNMPVWGEYFMVDALSDPRIDPKSARDIVAGRISSVVYYVQSLQSK
jgi:mono/diheme cytochrome c family protein